MSFWVAGATTVVGIAGAAVQYDAAGKAADAQGDAADAAVAEQRRQFDTMLNLSANQRGMGNQALNAVGSIYGYAPAPGYSNAEYAVTGGEGLRSREPILVGDEYLPPNVELVSTDGGKDRYYDVMLGGAKIGEVRPGGANGRFINQTGADTSVLWRQWEQDQLQQSQQPTGPGSAGGNQLAGPDYSAFYQSPDYQFRRGQGLETVQNSAAARGGLYSGNALRAITDYGSGLAAGEFGNYVNRQLALAGMGQTATTQAGNAAMTTGANIGNLLVGQGNARASGIVGQTNAITGGANDLASLYGLYRGGYFGSGGGGGGGGTGYWGGQAVMAGGG